jgi:hypothetical protein
MTKAAREMSIGEWLAAQEWLPSALAERAACAANTKALRIRTSTAESQFRDSVAEIIEKYPTGDDPTSDRFQANSLIQEQKIGVLFRKRWDAEAKALGYRVAEERSRGGGKGGGKSNIASAEAWQENATPIYRELRAKFPKASASDLAWKIVRDPRVSVPDKGRVERWVSAMDKKSRPRAASA